MAQNVLYSRSISDRRVQCTCWKRWKRGMETGHVIEGCFGLSVDCILLSGITYGKVDFVGIFDFRR